MDDVRAAYELDGSTDSPAARLILELQDSSSLRLMRDARQEEIQHILLYRRLPDFVDFRQTVRARDGHFDRLRLLEREIGDLMERGQSVTDQMEEYKRIRGYLRTAFQPGWHYLVLKKNLRAARRRLVANPIPNGAERIRRGVADERLPVAWEIRPDIVRQQVTLTMPRKMSSNVHYGGLMDRITADVLQGASGMPEDLLRRLFRSEIADRGLFIRGMAPESLILLVFGRIISGNESSSEGLGTDEISALSRRIKERKSQFRSDDIVQSMANTLQHAG
jgi:hypothetical protein